MVEGVLNARLYEPGDLAYGLLTQVSSHDIPAQRQRQARLRIPPLAQVLNQSESLALVGELALVDKQPYISLAARDVAHNLVERHHEVLHLGLVKLQSQKGRRPLSGYRHRLALEVLTRTLP